VDIKACPDHDFLYHSLGNVGKEFLNFLSRHDELGVELQCISVNRN
jgi:hypothetical protein